MDKNNELPIFDEQDVRDNKPLVIISWIIGGILFFLPLIACPNSRYGRFYCNQALLLLIIGVVATAVNVIPILGQIVFAVLGVFEFICWLTVGISICKGEAKRCPIIGGIELIK